MHQQASPLLETFKGENYDKWLEASMDEEITEAQQVEALRKSIGKRITLEADRIVDELFGIVYDEEVDAKVKLSAINILLDRALPKLGVQHQKEEETEERGSHKDIRLEIEKLILGESE
jgi:hypothetical protein